MTRPDLDAIRARLWSPSTTAPALADDVAALFAYVEELETDRATLLHREVMLKRAHGALADAGCVVPIEIDRTIEHAINALAQERDEERMRTRCFEQALAEAQADLEDTREALHATQSKSDYWRNEFRNERLTFESCNRARQAAEDECTELRARIAELETQGVQR